jgi:hypothetical protein
MEDTEYHTENGRQDIAHVSVMEQSEQKEHTRLA